MNVYLISLGCAKNRVDSEMIVGYMRQNGFVLVDEPQEAELLMVNTCAFIESARKEAIDTILDLACYKTKGKKLVVCGCLPQRYDELEKLLPEVDRFVRISEYGNIVAIVESLFNQDYEIKGEFSPLNKFISTPNYMRYVKISEGCLNRCAFCAIPLIRGKLKSRTIESIYDEVSKAVSEGAYEINLISQDTTRYGFDLYKKNALIDLLTRLVQISGDFKIRLLYLYPDIVTDDLIKFIKENDKVMPYFDIPIQHSEDNILNLMKRRGSKEYMLDLFKKIRTEIPHAVLRTTLIVGFPYETKEDVDNLCQFIKEVKFDRLGAFTFSPEEGTLALTYPQEITEAEKTRRYEKVMATQAEVALELMEKKLNQVEEVFIVGYDEESYMYLARNYAFAPDDIDGVIYVACKNEHQLGDRIMVKYLDCDAYSLTGEEVCA